MFSWLRALVVLVIAVAVVVHLEFSALLRSTLQYPTDGLPTSGWVFLILATVIAAGLVLHFTNKLFDLLRRGKR